MYLDFEASNESPEVDVILLSTLDTWFMELGLS